MKLSLWVKRFYILCTKCIENVLEVPKNYVVLGFEVAENLRWMSKEGSNQVRPRSYLF